MFCQNCGDKLADDDKFCSKCGEKIENLRMADNRFVRRGTVNSINQNPTKRRGLFQDSNLQSEKEETKIISNPASKTFKDKPEDLCKNCGFKPEDNSKFCENCGAEIKNTESKSKTVAAAVINNIPVQIGVQTVIRTKRKKILWTIGSLVVLIVIIIIVSSIYTNFENNQKALQRQLMSQQQKTNQLSNQLQNSQKRTEQLQQTAFDNSKSVVNIMCDNGNGGSGTIFTTDGWVLTNNHVIKGASTCEVTLPDPITGNPVSIYEANPVFIPDLSKKYDIAMLEIYSSYTDSDGKTWGDYPTTFPDFNPPDGCASSTLQLGDSVKIYGYPVTSGGYNLTITEGIISSFDDDGNILTSAKIDSGNSGGLAIDQKGCFVGIPSAVVQGNYQNLGVIISASNVEDFINQMPSQ